MNTLKVENAELKARPIKTYAEVTGGVLAERWRKKNVILIGVKENDSEDLYDLILKIAREVGIDLDLSEVSNAIRLGKPNPQIDRPRPIMVALVTERKRDELLRTRFQLRKSKDYSKLWINADESVEVRKARSMLRVAASNARQSECVVQQKHSEISIGGIRNGLNEVDKIPKDCPPQGRPLNPKGKQLKGGVPETTVRRLGESHSIPQTVI